MKKQQKSTYSSKKRVDFQKIIAEAKCLCESLNLLVYMKDILMCKIIEITESQLSNNTYMMVK